MNETVVSYLSQAPGYALLVEKLSEFFGFDASGFVTFLIFALVCFVVVNVMSAIGGLGTYAERKISADLQMRQGPNRVGPFGILQFLADGVKMLGKEDILPAQADKFLFLIAPLMCMVGVFASLAVVPFSSGLTLTNLNIGVFYLIGVSSLVGVGIFLGGYAANSKWSMLGGMRGASQIISYEVPVTLSILAIVLMTGSLSFNVITDAQGGLPHQWYLFHNPFTFIAFFVLFIGALAETNRAPFDLPEAESELVSGYHTEFSGMRFAFFALAEYVEVFVVCGVVAALFLGGYKVPFDLGNGELIAKTFPAIHPMLAKQIGNVLQLKAFILKTLALYYVVIWIRWTLPRLRVDSLMVLCWKYLTPIALFNLVGCAVWLWAFEGKSMWAMIFKSGVAAAGGHH